MRSPSDWLLSLVRNVHWYTLVKYITASYTGTTVHGIALIQSCLHAKGQMIMHAHAVQQQHTIKSLCPEPFGPFEISLTFHNLGLKLAIIDMGFVSMNPMQQRRQHATLRGQVQLSKWQQTATNYCFMWHRQDQKQICRLDTAQYWRTLSAIGNLVKGNSTHLSDCATFSVCNDMLPRCY